MVTALASQQSTAITSTKVRITSNATVHIAVGVSPTAYVGNCEIIAANTTRYINMEGLGNMVALIANSSPAVVSITTIGSVAASGITSSSDTYRGY
jgi:hypothetical protein